MELVKAQARSPRLNVLAKVPLVPDAAKPAPWGLGFEDGLHEIKERGACEGPKGRESGMDGGL